MNPLSRIGRILGHPERHDGDRSTVPAGIGVLSILLGAATLLGGWPQLGGAWRRPVPPTPGPFRFRGRKTRRAAGRERTVKPRPSCSPPT